MVNISIPVATIAMNIRSIFVSSFIGYLFKVLMSIIIFSIVDNPL